MVERRCVSEMGTASSRSAGRFILATRKVKEVRRNNYCSDCACACGLCTLTSLALIWKSQVDSKPSKLHVESL